MRVLVVDDDAINRRILMEMLSAVDVDVVEADLACAALNLLEGEVFDLVLMDVRMPDMDGFEAVRRIRRLSGEAATTPVVMVTGDVTSETSKRAAECGADHVLHKPVDMRVLLRTVARLILTSAQGALA